MQPHPFPKKIIVSLLIILILGLLVIFGQDLFKKPTPITKENVSIKTSDLSISSASKIPAGFPSDIKINTAGIVESYTATYPDRGVVQSTVSFNLTNTADVAFATYSVALSKAGYVFTKGGNDIKQGFIEATKNGDVVSMVIKTVNNKTLAQVTYLKITKK